MDKMKRYKAIIISILLTIALIVGGYSFVKPQYDKMVSNQSKIEKLETKRKNLNKEVKIVKDKIAKIKESIISAQKKIYSPVESDLGDETLFFTLYNDVIEMVHANKIKIRSITPDYEIKPEDDNFVKYGKGAYFVADMDMELVSNYVDLGKLVQDLYQYSYYIKIKEINVRPYEKDKKILITNLSLRFYSRTEPDDVNSVQKDDKKSKSKKTK